MAVRMSTVRSSNAPLLQLHFSSVLQRETNIITLFIPAGKKIRYRGLWGLFPKLSSDLEQADKNILPVPESNLLPSCSVLESLSSFNTKILLC